MTRLLAVLTTALLATALLAACGGGDSGPSKEATYKSAFEPLNLKIVATGTAVAEAVNTAEGKSAAEIATEFLKLQQQAAKLGDDVAALSPPTDLEQDNTALASGLRNEATNLGDIVKAAEQSDAAAAKAATIALLSGSAAVRDPRRRIVKALGIDEGTSTTTTTTTSGSSS